MKTIRILFVLFAFSTANAQTCDEIMAYVKSNGYPITYYSPASEAISQVSFYKIYEDYEYYYFAIVCFKAQYSPYCNEYIYQVGSMTDYYYGMNYRKSAGEAFWNYIQPYSNQLGCSP